MSATINGKAVTAMHFNGQNIASAWRDGKMVWSGVKPSSNAVREWVFPTRSDGNIMLSNYLQRAFGGDIVLESGDMQMSTLRTLPQLSLNPGAVTLAIGAHVEPIIYPSDSVTPGASSEWIIATKVTSPGSGYSGSSYPSGAFRLFIEAEDRRFVGVQLSATAASCGVLYRDSSDADFAFAKPSVPTSLPANAGGAEWGDLTVWYKDGVLRYYRNFSLLGTVHLGFRLDNVPVKPKLYLEVARTGSVFSQKLVAPPRLNFLAAYTGTEAASRASIWNLKT